jgi:hypothetical protein
VQVPELYTRNPQDVSVRFQGELRPMGAGRALTALASDPAVVAVVMFCPRMAAGEAYANLLHEIIQQIRYRQCVTLRKEILAQHVA